MSKKLSLLILFSTFFCLALHAQEQKTVIDNSIYLERYKLLTARVGDCGMGVETLLDKWEAADPIDINMMLGRFNYYAAKAVRDTLVKRNAKSYMGSKPVLSLKDSSGVTWNYFNDHNYDDKLFAEAIKWLDKALAADNTKFELYVTKANELLYYEKEKPVKSVEYLLSVIDRKSTNKSRWMYYGKDLTQESFDDTVQDFCAEYFNIGTEASYEAFRLLSERMLKYRPETNFFLDNLGTYYLVVKKNYSKAKKYYQKSLKINPKDEAAIKNMAILAKMEAAKSAGKNAKSK